MKFGRLHVNNKGQNPPNVLVGIRGNGLGDLVEASKIFHLQQAALL